MINDTWTTQLESLMLEIAKVAEENKLEYYFSGGISIDLAIGELTREHEDLDFHPLDKDTQWWKTWFKSKGYLLGKDPDMNNFPSTFKLTDEKDSYFADVYPVEPNERGEITLFNREGKFEPWVGHSWKERKKVIYKNTPVWIENPKNVIEQKLRHSKEFEEKQLPEKHQHDLNIYNKLLKGIYGELDSV